MYTGWFINLDKSRDRRDAIESQIQKFGLQDRYERLSAFEGGFSGCFRSHYSAVQKAKAGGIPAHILEDDTIFSSVTSNAIESFATNGILDDFDIVFTETIISPDAIAIHALRKRFDELRAKNHFEILDVTATYKSSMASYVISPGKAAKIVEILAAGLDASVPIDLFLRAQAVAGKLKLGCIFPFVTTVPIFFKSTITEDTEPLAASRAAIDALRYSFFVERDMEYALSKIKEIRSDDVGTSHDQLIEAILGFVASGRHVLY